MYEPIPPDLTAAVAVFTILPLIFGIPLVIHGPKMKRLDLTLIGAGLLVALVVGWVFGSGPISAAETNRRETMENNILTKYNEKYHPNYLKDVEFSGHGGKGETGKYFTLTYEDMTTEKRKFYFSESGEPSCGCTLKQ